MYIVSFPSGPRVVNFAIKRNQFGAMKYVSHGNK